MVHPRMSSFLASVSLLLCLIFGGTVSSSFAFSTVATPTTPTTDTDPIATFLQNSFVWCPVSIPGDQVYVAFQGNFTIPSSSASSPLLLHLFADVRYILFIDGTYLSRGPGRFNPLSPDYDTLNITTLTLDPSLTHTFTVLVHNYGSAAINGRIMYHTPGFTLALEDAFSSLILYSTSSSDLITWRCSNATEYLPSPVSWSSIPDAIDGRINDYRLWVRNLYVLSSVTIPVAIDGSTWGTLHARDLPMPSEISLTSALTLLPSQAPLVLPLTLTTGQSLILNVSEMAMIYITLNFDAQNGGDTVTLDYALRYVDNTPSETYGTGTNYIARPGNNAVLIGDTWVSHYIIFTCVSGNITLNSFNVTRRRYPFTTVGSFRSSDPLLNAIYDRSLNTLAAVTDDAYGSDARERNEWLQDPAQPNFITTSLAFGTEPSVYTSSVLTLNTTVSDPRLLRLLLRHASLGQLSDGRIRATFPTDRGSSDCHYFIEDYALQWIEALRWYYDTTMDTEFVLSVWSTVVNQLDWFSAHIDSTTGLLLAREYTSFDDPLAYITLEGTALNSFYYKGLLDAAYLAQVLNNITMMTMYLNNASVLRTNMNTVLWNSTVGSYNSGIMNNQSLGPTVHAAMLALHKGILPFTAWNNATNTSYGQSTMNFFLNNYGNPGKFHVCSNPDYMEMIADRAGINMTVSHYWVYSVLYTIDSIEGDTEVLGRMRDQWGNMVVNGNDAGTLWESFYDSESCHNYGAVNLWFLTTKVLGIKLYDYSSMNNVSTFASSLTLPIPLKRTLIIEPHLGDLTFIQGTSITPLGIVNITWSRVSSVLSFTLVYPVNLLNLILRLPDSKNTTFYLNNELITNTVTEGRYTVLTIPNPDTFSTTNTLIGNITLTTNNVPTIGYTVYADGRRIVKNVDRAM